MVSPCAAPEGLPVSRGAPGAGPGAAAKGQGLPRCAPPKRGERGEGGGVREGGGGVRERARGQGLPHCAPPKREKRAGGGGKREGGGGVRERVRSGLINCIGNTTIQEEDEAEAHLPLHHHAVVSAHGQKVLVANRKGHLVKSSSRRRRVNRR